MNATRGGERDLLSRRPILTAAKDFLSHEIPISRLIDRPPINTNTNPPHPLPSPCSHGSRNVSFSTNHGRGGNCSINFTDCANFFFFFSLFSSSSRLVIVNILLHEFRIAIGEIFKIVEVCFVKHLDKLRFDE